MPPIQFSFVLQRTRIQCRQNSPGHLFLSCHHDHVLILNHIDGPVLCILFGAPLSEQQQLVSSHFSLWGNGGCVVGNRDHRRSFHPAVLFNRLLVKTWGKSAQKHNLKLQKYHLFQLRNGTFFGLCRIYAPCHVFAYICANTRTSVLKKTWIFPIISLEKGSILFAP